jgi:hypothetical protein
VTEDYFDWIGNRRLVFNVLVTATVLAIAPMIPLMFTTTWKQWVPTLLGAVAAGVVQRILKNPQAIDRDKKLESGELVGDRARDPQTQVLPAIMPESKKD